MTQVLVVGSLHHDVIVNAPRIPALDETLAGSSVRYAFGGKGGNQAIAAARHGAATAFAGRVGDDEAGRFMLARLDEADVERSGVIIGDGEATGMSVAVVTPGGDYGAVIVSAANLAIDPAALSMPQGLRVLLLQNEVRDEVNLAAARLARQAGALVALNAAPARGVPGELMDLAGLLVANRVEAEMLTGVSCDSVEGAREAAQALGGGKRAAIVTLGAAGAVLAGRRGGTLPILAHKVETVSSHGAGDCFCGALAARLAFGDGIDAALRYAMAAAALHVAADPERRSAIGPAQTTKLLEEQGLAEGN
jgi:ribokinase